MLDSPADPDESYCGGTRPRSYSMWAASKSLTQAGGGNESYAICSVASFEVV